MVKNFSIRETIDIAFSSELVCIFTANDWTQDERYWTAKEDNYNITHLNGLWIETNETFVRGEDAAVANHLLEASLH